MDAIIILGLIIMAGAVIGLGVLHLAHEFIISRLYSVPLIDNESMQGPDTPLSNAASRQSAAN